MLLWPHWVDPCADLRVSAAARRTFLVGGGAPTSKNRRRRRQRNIGGGGVRRRGRPENRILVLKFVLEVACNIIMIGPTHVQQKLLSHSIYIEPIILKLDMVRIKLFFGDVFLLKLLI